MRMITSPTRPMAWLVRRHHRQRAEVVQDIFRRDGLLADAAFGKRQILRDRRIEMVAHHQHVEMLVDGVAGERPRRIGRGRQHVLQARHLDDVGRVAAAGAFGVEGVDGAALEGLDGVLDEAGLVERVGVDHHLHVVVVGDRQAAVDRRRRGAPVLVQLERTGAGLDHFLQRRRARGIALAGEAEIDREGVGGLDHAADMERPRRAGGGIGAGRRTGAAAEHGGDAGHQRLVDLLRADEMDVGVEAAGGEDFSFAGDDLGAGADDDGDAGLDVGIAGFADGRDAAVLDADVGFDDAPVIEDQRIGDDGVDRASPIGDLRLAHAVADHLAAAEFHLLAVDGEILFHLDDQIGVGQPHAVAGGRPEHVGIGRALHFNRHVHPQGYQQANNAALPGPPIGIRFPAGHPSSALPDTVGRHDRSGHGTWVLLAVFVVHVCRSWLSVTGYRWRASRRAPGNGSESL